MTTVISNTQPVSILVTEGCTIDELFQLIIESEQRESEFLMDLVLALSRRVKELETELKAVRVGRDRLYADYLRLAEGEGIMSGDVMYGQVIHFNNTKGYGFARVEGADQDVMIHVSEFDEEGYVSLYSGDCLSLQVVHTEDGKLRGRHIRRRRFV